ncbi:MAG: hypothetical protein ACK48G_01525, partial [Chitinophagaceae bacterium]
MKRIAIITTHPIQNHSPWFRHMAQDKRIELKVFYTLGKHQEGYLERDFGVRVHWNEHDLKGYSYEFLQNEARNPDSLSFWG